MPVDLSQTLDLHRRILSDLELREAATKEQETEARRAFDNALQSVAAERRAIKQCRELLTQAATLYQGYAWQDGAAIQTDSPQPTEAPVAAAAPEQVPAPAVAVDEPSALAIEAPALEAVPLPGATTEAEEAFARVENLRSEITAETGREGGGNWWTGMWRRGPRDAEVELSWKEAYPPVEGADRAIWDHHHANRTQE